MASRLTLVPPTLNTKVVMLAVLAAAVAVTLATTLSDSNNNQLFEPKVLVTFGKGKIDVMVRLPGVSYYNYVTARYLGYSTTSILNIAYTNINYSKIMYYTPIPVKVIIVVEKITSEMVAYKTLDLEAYGQNNTATVTFTGLEAGSYRVKVMFWNDLLSRLAEIGGLWKPYANPVVEEGYVS